MRTPETLRAGSSLTYDRKSLGHANYMAEYEIELKDPKCYGLYNGGGGDNNEYGRLYTISKEERMYDEPFVGELRTRSWLCCPGSQPRLDVEQPALLDNKPAMTASVKDQPILQAPPAHLLCTIGCVCNFVSPCIKMSPLEFGNKRF